MVVEIGEEFELDDRFSSGCVGNPSPDPVSVGLELGIAKRVLKFARIDRAARDFKIDLHVDISCSCVGVSAFGAKKFRDKSTDDDEFGTCAVVMHDPHESRFRCCACVT